MEAEPFGDEGLRQAQLRYYAQRAHLRALPESFEQGRSFCLSAVTTQNISRRVAAASNPPRLLVHTRWGSASDVEGCLAGMGYRVSSPLLLVAQRRVEVLQACHGIIDRRLLDGLEIVCVDTGSPCELVEAVQKLHQRCSITPLPGWFLRGSELPVRTLAIVDRDGAPLAAGTVQDIRSSGQSASMGLAICVAPSARGCGLGTFLNARLLVDALFAFGSRRAVEILEYEDGASRRMNENCGLLADPEWCYVFAEQTEEP